MRSPTDYPSSRHAAAVLLLLAVLFPGMSRSETVSWADCVKEARKNNPDIMSALEGVKQDEAVVVSTRSRLLPEIGSSLSGGRSGREGAGSEDGYSVGLSAKQLVFDGGKAFNDTRRSKEQLETTKYRYEFTSSTVRMQLRLAFISLLKAQRQVTIMEDILKRRQQTTRLIRRRYEGGKEHRGSLMTAEAKEAQSGFDVMQAKRNVELAGSNLAELLGRLPSAHAADLAADGKFEVSEAPASRPDFESLAEGTPSVKQLISKSNVAKYSAKSAKGGYYPTVSASAGAGKSASEWPPDEDSWSIGVSMSLPLFEGGSRVAEVSRANAALRQANADEKGGRNSAVATLHAKWIALQNAVERIKVREKFLEASRERAKISEGQYSAGLLGFDSWIIIEDDFVAADQALIEAQAGALAAEAEWVNAKGGTLENESN
jgi:outer membrane protein TolC